MPARKTVPPSKTPAEGVEFSPSEIHDQLECILNSPEFKATQTQRAFLQYVIGKTVAGRSEEIKGYTVATEVFGRSEDFDQSTDPVVSIQANKLRRALERYYLVAGQNDPLRIDIPKGAYVPTFQQQSALPGASPSHYYQPAAARIETAWPSLAVQPLANFTDNPEFENVGIAIASEIASEITRYKEIRVYLQYPEKRKRRASDIGARFVLNGSIIRDLSSLRMNVGLTDTSTGVQIWADMHRADLNPAHLMAIGGEVARIVAGKIAAEYGIIARQLSIEAKHTPPLKLSTYEAMLLYHEFNAQFTAPLFFNAMEALRQACLNEPKCGLAYSMLSRLYTGNYGLELFEMDTPIQQAVEYAQIGVKLDPANQRSRASLAFALMLAEEIPSARAEADRALDLNPESLISLDNIGYLLALLGDWQRGTALIRKAIELNPYYNVVAHHALWLDLFRQKDYQRAYLETLSFRTPNLFWDHLAKAATLGLLDRIQEGRQASNLLLHLKPEFARRGKLLIGHFVKDDEIVERLIDGLRRVGIEDIL